MLLTGQTCLIPFLPYPAWLRVDGTKDVTQQQADTETREDVYFNMGLIPEQGG